jgi:hypothetical protein
MSISVTALYTSAQYKFGADAANIRFQDDFYSALNAAQREMCITRSWGFLRTSASLTTVADTQTVALPSDFGKFYNVPNVLVITSPSANSGDTIELMTEEQWRMDDWEDGTETGTPSMAYAQGDNLYLSPTPDAEYIISVVYYKIPANIADSSSTITVPDVYEEVLRSMVWKRLQLAGYSSVQEIQISDSEIQRLLNRAARDDCKKYGSATFNLASTTYERSTI